MNATARLMKFSIYRPILFLLLVSSLFHLNVNGQPIPDSFNTHKSRKWLIGGIQTSLWTGTFIALNKAWYANYQKEKFHFFNDWREWQQMDKLGHVWTTYQISRASASSWNWAGLDNRKSILMGAASGIAFQSIIEILDGYSAKWGFSGYDMLANITGASMFALSELSKKPHFLTMKLSYMPVEYGLAFNGRADDLFGKDAMGRVLKDYNGQTYWLSFNLKSISPNSKVPKWLNLAVGHGARTMLGGTENSWFDETGTFHDARNMVRERRFYISLDIDLTQIQTRKKWLKTTFSLLNCLKIPAPALEYSTSGKWMFHPIHY